MMQINGRLNRLSRILIQIDSQKNFLDYWYKWTHDSIVPLWLGLCPIGFHLVWPFWACRMQFDLVWPFWAFAQMTPQEKDPNQLMTQAVSQRVESIQFITQVAFQGINSESTHHSSRSPGIDSDRLITQVAFQGIDSEPTHDSSGSPRIDSNRLVTQRKNVWFWVDSWFNSESYPCLASRMYRCEARHNPKTPKVLVEAFDEYMEGRHGYDSFFHSIQLSLRKFWFRVNS